MNKTPIEFLIDYCGCDDDLELQHFFGDIDIDTITDAMETYAEFYHQSKLRERESQKSAFVTLDMEDMGRWNIDKA